ncbi:TSUP family transporter [Candidatus Latescibacterota bacterium]
MMYLIIALASFLVAGLTFFSGFGLGTLLLPLFALFFSVPVAVAATAVVHLLNNISKVVFVGKYADRNIALRFGIPAVIAAFCGAWVLGYISDMDSIYSYTIFNSTLEIFPVKLTIGILMIVFGLFELLPFLNRFQIEPKWIPAGGVLSGFFGGLSGHQGALRTVFLTRAGLRKEAFIGTIAVIGACVDVMRIFVYGLHRFSNIEKDTVLFVFVATVSAWAGSFLGSRLLKKIKLRIIRIIIGCMLLLLGCSLALGFI